MVEKGVEDAAGILGGDEDLIVGEDHRVREPQGDPVPTSTRMPSIWRTIRVVASVSRTSRLAGGAPATGPGGRPSRRAGRIRG